MSEISDAIIYVVDDDASARNALNRLLTQAGYAVESYASVGEFLVTEHNRGSGCLLLDLELPGAGGLELQLALHRQGSRMPIVFISAYNDIPRTVLAIKAGAIDFLLKPVETRTLLAAIDCALAAGTSLPEADKTPDEQIVSLNDRERAVLRGMVAGRLNKKIACDLALSERTIKSCRAELMRKHGVHSLAELIMVSKQTIVD